MSRSNRDDQGDTAQCESIRAGMYRLNMLSPRDTVQDVSISANTYRLIQCVVGCRRDALQRVAGCRRRHAGAEI